MVKGPVASWTGDEHAQLEEIKVRLKLSNRHTTGCTHHDTRYYRAQGDRASQRSDVQEQSAISRAASLQDHQKEFDSDAVHDSTGRTR